MQSHQDSFGASDPSKKFGHRRTPSLGKAMPVTTLLLNCPPPTIASMRSSQMSDGSDSTKEGHSENSLRYLPINETSTLTPTTPSRKSDIESEEEMNFEQDYELLVSECSSDDGHDDDTDSDSDEKISLVGNSIFYTPCLTCTDLAPNDLGARSSAINEMCRRLCTDECRLRLSLAGLEPPSTLALQSKEVLEEFVKDSMLRTQLQDATYNCSITESTRRKDFEESIKQLPKKLPLNHSRPPSRITIQRKKFLTNILMHNVHTDSDDTDSNYAADDEDNPELLDVVTSIVVPRRHEVIVNDQVGADDDKKVNAIVVDPHEMVMLKDFREKFEIAEALAKTSAMTSTSQMKQRLAARKLEIELENVNANENSTDDEGDAAKEEKQALSMTTNAARDKGVRAASGTDVEQQLQQQGAAAAKTSVSTDLRSKLVEHIHVNDNDIADITAATAAADTKENHQQKQKNMDINDFEPPRDLLLYLVRMGSFNSAPKINNIDSQDDTLEMPKGLNSNELLEHVKYLRGEHQPPLLTRYFVKPSLAAQMVSNDITDGLRSLKLNSVTRDYTAPISSPNHIRLLQWNILSQTLGQNNDGFVRCPEEALTWENRKFLIVQEILQNNPDIVCLQEVDHFKFLQNILGSQNYEGIFFPKPDSPCLYIEENNGPDGCAIFFKRDKFELKNFDTRILEVWRVQSNQVAIVANLGIKSNGMEFCVCTTHLKARHGSLLSKLRNEQGRDLIRFVKKFASDRPVLLCGDFNAEPIEPVYTTILNCDILKMSSAYADIKAERDECNNAEHEDYGNAEEAKDACDKVEKSIQREPPYTTWKIREDGEECHTIDYVFYTKDHFKVKNCLEFPHGDDIGKNRTPSFQYPSDHFSLVCDFEIMDKH